MTTLVTLRPGVSFEAEAAASWARMETERGRPLDVNRSTVSRAEQQKKYDDYRAYLAGGPWAPLALPPDKSWHCEPIARASDTDDDEWIRAHPDHGWRFVVKDEKWHAQYYPHLDRHRGEGMPAGGGARPIPTPTPEEEEDMQHRAFLMATSINDQPNGPFNRWSCDAVAGTKRNIDAAEWEFQNKTLGIQEVNPGIQPSDRLNSYRQIW